MKEWKDLPETTLYWMKMLGEFSPTVNVDYCEVKGYTLDEDGQGGKTYLTSTDLFAISLACQEVAQWLEERADGGQL